MGIVRKPNGQFDKGTKTNGAISPFRKAAIEALSPEMLAECMREMYRQVIHAKTEEGRREAAKIVFNYVLGRPTQHIVKEVETTSHTVIHPERLSDEELSLLLKAIGEEPVIEIEAHEPTRLEIDTRADQAA